MSSAMRFAQPLGKASRPLAHPQVTKRAAPFVEAKAAKQVADQESLLGLVVRSI